MLIELGSQRAGSEVSEFTVKSCPLCGAPTLCIVRAAMDPAACVQAYHIGMHRSM